MNFLLTVLSIALKFLDILCGPIYSYRSKGKRKFLPPIKNEILRISATDLAVKIRKKELSSTEICMAYIDRIKEVNPILKAVVEERFAEALREARNVDEYLTKCSLGTEELSKIKPLLGVPVTVKESCSVQGLSYSVGTKKRIGFKAETDGELVSRLKASGAIILLVSTTPEICLAWETHNFITGTTNNSYDTTRTSGGSSGGEGALIGSGASLIGLGSDIAGSIRLPALYNGIFGHKPTPRIAPIKGHFPYCQDPKYSDFLVIGPMVRYAKDLKLMMKVLVGGKLSGELKLNTKVNLSKINVFFMEDLGNSGTQPVQVDIVRTIRDAVRHLQKKCGSQIQNYKFEGFEEAVDSCVTPLYTIEDIPNLLKEENLGVELLKSVAGQSQYTFGLLYFYLIQNIYKSFISFNRTKYESLRKTVIEKLNDNGVLLFPTFPCSAPKHHQTYLKMTSVAYLAIANALQLPATHVPCGFDQKGMPIGFQVIAAPKQDRLCFAVAEELEERFGGWIPPPEK